MLLMKRFCCGFQRINAITKTRQPGDTLEVRGWIKSVRRLKNNVFFDISDGSTMQKFQIVVPKSEQLKTISAGNLVKVVGQLQVAPQGHYELHANSLETIAEGNLNSGYPFSPKQQHDPEYVREYLHLRSRTSCTAAIMRLRHKAQMALHEFMDKHDFIHINTPILTTNDCEGAGEVFTVQPDSNELLKQMSRPSVPLNQSYFDSKVYLSVSGQLHLESMSYGLGNTYTISPAFRAENCKSPLHLSEFYMFEAELVFIENLEELCRFIEKMIKSVTNDILKSSEADIQYCQNQTVRENFNLQWLRDAWPILSYNEASDIILRNKEKFKTAVKSNEGFSKEQELFLVDYCKAPVFVVNWPAAQKPFYMKISREDPSKVHALDLLMPVVAELCGGSLRECDVNRLQEHPHFPEGLEWYLELRKFGGLPTGGFGMGFERFLQLLTGVKNIRDVIPFPRYPHSCKM
ncbi:probable asparagine--tRNA ligase, mitochondrial [Glossina fuscipes]|uniref:asparagine--tRNA ligase n=1 Tax=Glossina fuscipes TaxID=7396 RepID=A0A9C6DTC9_9MUSC|nr:probable asparagine--tRNA ligase, mitochondrial [Glossina fuscipes]KAI9582912.1 hypothetical protein GQX74_012129 [Glossina fuscipes]